MGNEEIRSAAAGEGWTWHRSDDSGQAAEKWRQDEAVRKWIGRSEDRDVNHLAAVSFQGKRNAVFGTLVVGKADDDRGSNCTMHFYLGHRNLYTIGFQEEDIIDGCEGAAHFFAEIDQSETALDGFIKLLAGIMEPFFDGMDKFEQKLREMEENIRDRNGGYMFHRILELRYSLLHWTGLTRPVREIRFALEEAFPEAMKESLIHQAFNSRLERMIMLQEEYRQEVESLLLLEDNISNYRGNEIMKTLTVFTILCTPMMAIGAIWGMNFEQMPELKWKLGYVFGLAVILAATVGVYFWMRTKGWMGDLLREDNRRERL